MEQTIYSISNLNDAQYKCQKVLILCQQFQTPIREKLKFHVSAKNLTLNFSY